MKPSDGLIDRYDAILNSGSDEEITNFLNSLSEDDKTFFIALRKGTQHEGRMAMKKMFTDLEAKEGIISHKTSYAIWAIAASVILVLGMSIWIFYGKSERQIVTNPGESNDRVAVNEAANPVVVLDTSSIMNQEAKEINQAKQKSPYPKDLDSVKYKVASGVRLPKEDTSSFYEIKLPNAKLVVVQYVKELNTDEYAITNAKSYRYHNDTLQLRGFKENILPTLIADTLANGFYFLYLPNDTFYLQLQERSQFSKLKLVY